MFTRTNSNPLEEVETVKCLSNTRFIDELRAIEEVPYRYQKVFSGYACFNYIQSTTFDELFYTDDSVVISAPTGSGKTTLFELAIVRALMTLENIKHSDFFKMVYISPMKALCEERVVDWHKKFSSFGVNCISVTGDSENIEMKDLLNHNLIITTPERWDSITRKWKDNKKLLEMIKLFMIDEVHLLGEDNRGAALEIIVCRMKTIQNSIVYDEVLEMGSTKCHKIRFVALSATIPNVEDIAEWIGDIPDVKYFKFSDQIRPVKLNKIVLGYHFNPKSTYFKFDLALNYKLQNLMLQYSEGKPTLIFCSTRKIVEMTAEHLLKNLTINLKPDQKRQLVDSSNSITDQKLKRSIIYGIGYHHAGMLPETKRIVENLFRNSVLPVLVTTSTLAMGVNLPAHLVIIKSTKCYQNGQFIDYTETALLQMIGRAGRPQFDNTATAIILTTARDKAKFEKLVGNTQTIESNLHKHLTEHLNAEIVLRTITDLDVAMSWLTSTFLYVRAKKRPKYYGISCDDNQQIDKKLLDMCQIELNKLSTAKMLTIDMNMVLRPTVTGALMAKYYLAFPTVKLFIQLTGNEILQQILSMLSKCYEFSEMYLRVSDKKCLNLLNDCKNQRTIRFNLKGKIKTLDMKVNCLIQAVLGCLDISDHALLAETLRIMRNAERIINGLIEYLESRNKCYNALLNSVILSKCLKAKLWENSPYVAKQLKGIGNVIAGQLVSKGKTSFEKIANTNSREIEMILNKKPPFGDKILEEVKRLPIYVMQMEKISVTSINLIISLQNAVDLLNNTTLNTASVMYLFVGNSFNDLIIYEKYTHSYMIENIQVLKTIEISEDVEFIEACFISEDWAGIDVSQKLELIEKTEKVQEAKKSCKNIIVNKNKEKLINSKRDTYQTFLERYLKKKLPSIETQPLSTKKLQDSVKESCINNNMESKVTAQDTEKNKKLICDNDKIGTELMEENQNSTNNNGDLEHNIITDDLISPVNQEITFDNKRKNHNDNDGRDSFIHKSNSNLSDQRPNLQFQKYADKLFQDEKKSIIGKYKFTPSKKLVHDQDELDVENEAKKIKLSDVSTPKCKSTTRITWRSPLIYSPPVKYSPKANLNKPLTITSVVMTPTVSEASNQVELIKLNVNDVNVPKKKMSADLTSNRPKANNAALLKLNVIKGNDSIFPLSDKDSQSESITEFNSAIVNQYGKICSKSCFEKTGIMMPQNTVNSQHTSNDQNKPNLLAIDQYYSTLLSQPRTNMDAKRNVNSKSPDELSSNSGSNPLSYVNAEIFGKPVGRDLVEEQQVIHPKHMENFRIHNGRLCSETLTQKSSPKKFKFNIKQEELSERESNFKNQRIIHNKILSNKYGSSGAIFQRNLPQQTSQNLSNCCDHKYGNSTIVKTPVNESRASQIRNNNYYYTDQSPGDNDENLFYEMNDCREVHHPQNILMHTKNNIFPSQRQNFHNQNGIDNMEFINDNAVFNDNDEFEYNVHPVIKTPCHNIPIHNQHFEIASDNIQYNNNKNSLVRRFSQNHQFRNFEENASYNINEGRINQQPRIKQSPYPKELLQTNRFRKFEITPTNMVMDIDNPNNQNRNNCIPITRKIIHPSQSSKFMMTPSHVVPNISNHEAPNQYFITRNVTQNVSRNHNNLPDSDLPSHNQNSQIFSHYYQPNMYEDPENQFTPRRLGKVSQLISNENLPYIANENQIEVMQKPIVSQYFNHPTNNYCRQTKMYNSNKSNQFTDYGTPRIPNFQYSENDRSTTGPIINTNEPIQDYISASDKPMNSRYNFNFGFKTPRTPFKERHLNTPSQFSYSNLYSTYPANNVSSYEEMNRIKNPMMKKFLQSIDTNETNFD